MKLPKAKNNDKVKDSLPSKISTENWKKRKQSKGPGYFQQKRTKKVPKKLEDWEKLPIIPRRGEYHLPDNLYSDFVKIHMSNTCTIDNFLQILLVFYSLNIDQMQRLFDSTDLVVQKIGQVVQLLLTNDYSTAKYIWLTQICNLIPDSRGVISAYDTDKQITMHPLRDIFKRMYAFSTCSSPHCPLNSLDVKHDDICDVTLHSPDLEVKDTETVLQSINEWEAGNSSKALFSCKAEFVKEPSHSEYIMENDKDRFIIRCSGWRNPINMQFVTKPPFLVFEVSALFSSDLKDLSTIPHNIYVYGEHYRFGGATSNISARVHFVGYICLNNNDILFYDGLPSTNPVLRIYPQKNIYGELSLLFYFPLDNESTRASDIARDSLSLKSPV